MRRKCIFWLLFSGGILLGQRFRMDDPLLREPAPINVAKVYPRKFSDYYDFFYSTFGKPGDQNRLKSSPVRAMGTNTLGEPMAGAWWEPRHYYYRMSIEDLVRGPGNSKPPSDGPWLVVAAKNEGITPGFTIEDVNKRRYFLKFDPASNPDIATAPDVLVSKFFYALGYYVPENYIVEFLPDRLEVRKGTKLRDRLGKERPMTRRDITEILLGVPKRKDGRIRAVASLLLPGSYAGPFRFWGTRKDDPNDIVPHEHRRDLRGLSLACAWLGHDDSRSINTIDFVVEENGSRFVKHFLIDFGSALGSATDKANSPRSGFEYLFEWKPAIVQFATLGLHVPEWAKARYPAIASIGRFEFEKFDPLLWRSEYPNTAFSNRLPDDEFWMAKQIAAFNDDEIQAIVRTGQYSDPAAERWLVKCLIQRRNKIVKAFFPRVLPLDRFQVKSGTVVFEDLGKPFGVGAPPDLAGSWSLFDNERGRRRGIPTSAGFQIPVELKDSPSGTYAVLDISAGSAPDPRISVFLRKDPKSIEIVGIDRTWKQPIVPPAP